jgi:hypothetical protein
MKSVSTFTLTPHIPQLALHSIPTPSSLLVTHLLSPSPSLHFIGPSSLYSKPSYTIFTLRTVHIIVRTSPRDNAVVITTIYMPAAGSRMPTFNGNIALRCKEIFSMHQWKFSEIE